MLSVPVFDMKGKKSGQLDIHPDWFGGRVRPILIKQAIVAYLNHQRQWSARTKGKADVEGSTRKLYRQKGTGNARMGQVRTPVRRGGGRTFAKRIPGRSVVITKKMRRLALDSAILAKLKSNDVVIVDRVSFSEPKTRSCGCMVCALGVGKGGVFAMHEPDRNTLLSGRNVPATEVRIVDELNCYEVLRRKKLLFTKPAFEKFTESRKSRVA